MGKNFHNIGFDNDFLDMTLKVQITKEKDLELIKITNFCAKDTIQSEWKPMEQGNIFTNPIN